jgi:YVTN family beta-propeller protein
VGATRAYVTNTHSYTVSVIDTSSYTVVATVRVGQAPVGLDITPEGNML